MRLGILSNNSLLRRALAALLSERRDVQIIWEGESLESGDSTSRRRVEILLLEARSDSVDSLAIRQAKAAFAAARIIMLYDSPGDELAVGALLAGAHGCLSKRRDGENIVKAIDGVGRGELWVRRSVSSSALEISLQHEAKNGGSSSLSPREWEVFSFLATGKRNRQIALELHISEQTVKRHIYSLFRKLDVPSRLEACLLFYQMAPQLTPSGRQVETVTRGEENSKLPAAEPGSRYQPAPCAVRSQAARLREKRASHGAGQAFAAVS